MRKKMLLILTAIMLVGLFSSSVFALQSVGPVSSSAPSDESNRNDVVVENSIGNKFVGSGLIKEPAESVESQLRAFEKSNLTDKQKNVVKNKLNEVSFKTTAAVTSLSTTWSHLPGTFNLYTQSNSYYCVPASVKSAMDYLTGSSSSQSTIASAMGTTTSGTSLSAARTYLNDNQSKNNYVAIASTTTLTSMKSHFSASISTFKAPPVLGISTSTSDGWAYNTGGHALLVNAKRDDLEFFQLADPLIKFLNSNGNPYYSKSASTIHTAIANQGSGYIY